MSKTQKVSVKDLARRASTCRATIDRLIARGAINAPEDAEPRGWSADAVPGLLAQIETDKQRYRAAQLAAFDRARAVRTANLEAKRAKEANGDLGEPAD